MAEEVKIVTVKWVSQSNVPHRVCWKKVADTEFNCTTDGTHPDCGIGDCAYDFPITVDEETCQSVDYEGYVQPTCHDAGSTDGRIAFAFTFVPDPACNRYEVFCDESPVGSLTLTDGGSGYDPNNPPGVTFSGGGGAGATATSTVGDGEIQSLTITSGGSGYTDGTYTGVALVGGSGSNATADIEISGGAVVTATIANGGTGYQDSDVLAPDPAVVGTPSTAAELDPESDYGEVIALTLTDGGSGYTSEPTVTIDAPSSGTTATATASLRGCTELTIHDCSGATAESIPEGTYQPGESVFMCGQSTPTIPSDFSISEVGNCLCTCKAYTVDNTGTTDSLTVKWIDCNNGVQTATVNAGGSLSISCAVEGSLSHVLNGPDAVYSETAGADCNAVV